ncbi:MAG TPA: TrkA family potassium uptake protein [Chloroflexi bacterium]|jgi:trk system potassium uptake protein TrkA|nr:TrkA family potassium uptake protein [Chloroflexota bacterium]
MHVVIMGCGRTGSLLATMLTEAGHEISIIDWSEPAFQRLPDDFEGQTVLGNAVDQDVLVEAGIERADAFVAATSGDNRNVMASEVVQRVFHVPKVVSRIKDPNRAQIFQELGIEVDCRTVEGAEVLLQLIDA